MTKIPEGGRVFPPPSGHGFFIDRKLFLGAPSPSSAFSSAKLGLGVPSLLCVLREIKPYRVAIIISAC